VRADDYCWTCILLISGLGHQARQTPSGGCLEPRNQHAQVVTTHEEAIVIRSMANLVALLGDL
jgi:hypothetical protein